MILFGANVWSQTKTDLQIVVETEKSFARTADEKGVKPAFLEFLADDGIVFHPTAINGKEFWRARPESSASLSWYPVFADVSSNGVLGYTTGPGEYRSKGKPDTTVYYSEYATIWRKQADGNYKVALDIGVSHNKPLSFDTNWESPKTSAKVSEENKLLAAKFINSFFDTATTKGLGKAYKMFAAEDARFLRDGKFPIIGKANASAGIENSKITFGKSVTIQSASDLGYSVTTYEMKDGDKKIKKGIVMQVWKLFDGKWQIVLDVFSPIPEK